MVDNRPSSEKEGQLFLEGNAGNWRGGPQRWQPLKPDIVSHEILIGSGSWETVFHGLSFIW